MYVCYIDEAGDTGKFLSIRKDAQPAFILMGVILPQATLREYTEAFIGLKRQFYPGKCKGSKHDAILAELKGSDIRSTFTKNNQNNKRHALGFLSKLMHLLRAHNGKLIGRAFVKKPDAPAKPASIYLSSMQRVCDSFQCFLEENASMGMVICDSRDYNQNHQASHAIFTQMYKKDGDSYPRIIDMPTFGDSRNHAGIQTADLLCSALVYPMVMHAFCLDAGLRNTHIQPKYVVLRQKFHAMIGQMQYRHTIMHSNKTTYQTGGIVISDKLGNKPAHLLFEKPLTEDPASHADLQKLVQKFQYN